MPRSSDYSGLRRSWRTDLFAGVTVGIVALPLALGFGISSGVGAEAGLITAIIAGFLAAIFGGSNVQVSGPTGAMVVVLAPIVATQGVGAVAAVTLLAGLIVVIAGVLRLGRAVSFIPWPVIEGFTLGIAVIIFLQQIPALTRAESSGVANTNVMVSAITSIAGADGRYFAWSLMIVAIVAVCMFLLPHLHRAMPGSLIAVIISTGVALIVPVQLGTIGELPTALPALSLPTIDMGALTVLAPAAFAVAALAAIESLLSARVAASMANTGAYDPDRELIGQGLGSVGASLFGGMPATGAIARTAVNIRAGARSRVAAGFHAVVLLLVVLLFAAPASFIPLAALSGVLMVTAYQMVNRRIAASILRSTRGDAVAFAATAVVTVSVDLIFAVVIGVLIAGFIAVRNVSRAVGVHREPLPGPAAPGDDRIALIVIEGPLIFSSSERVLDEVLSTDQVSVVILRMSRIDLVDATGAHVLEELVQRLERRGITVIIKGVLDQHKRLFARVGVVSALRHENHLIEDLNPAIEHARSHVHRDLDPPA
ncbi:MAG: SulP family inorganic anion transporter [Leucobacter sp.]